MQVLSCIYTQELYNIELNYSRRDTEEENVLVTVDLIETFTSEKSTVNSPWNALLKLDAKTLRNTRRTASARARERASAISCLVIVSCSKEWRDEKKSLQVILVL